MGILRLLDKEKFEGRCYICDRPKYTYWFEITWSFKNKRIACSDCARRERKKEWERIMNDKG